MHSILSLVPHYGYILVYVLLTIELMGVPFLPGEILIIYCGFLVFKGELNVALVFISAMLGVISGMTASYFIGKKLGMPFFKKHGAKIHLGPKKMEKVTGILDKYGLLLIFFICFIPGLKHVIGYFSGISEMEYKKYAASSYIGAMVWAATFLTIGDVLGSNWNMFHVYIRKYLVAGAIIMVTLIALFYIIKVYRYKILNFVVKIIMDLFNRFNSLGTVRFFILIVAIIFVGFIDIFANIVSGLISNDFIIFNNISHYIIERIFGEFPIFSYIFKGIDILTSNWMYLVIPALIILFVLGESKNKKIEIKYIIITICGGFIIKFAVMYASNIASQYISMLSNFLDERSFTAIVIYGFLAYVLFTYTNKLYLKRILIGVFVAIGLATGLSQLFFGYQLSSVLSGYTLGVIWVSLNVILLEIGKSKMYNIK